MPAQRKSKTPKRASKPKKPISKRKALLILRKYNRAEREGEPTRPTTPFFRFLRDIRDDIKEAHPEYKVTDIGREAGVQWRALSAESKKPYEEAYLKQRAEYVVALAEYKAKKASGAGDDEGSH